MRRKVCEGEGLCKTREGISSENQERAVGQRTVGDEPTSTVVDGRICPVHVLRNDLNTSISSSRRAIRTENGDEGRLRSAQPDRLEMIGRSSVDR